MHLQDNIWVSSCIDVIELKQGAGSVLNSKTIFQVSSTSLKSSIAEVNNI